MSKNIVLSLDGGGIRGLIPALVLRRLEEKLREAGVEKPLHACFDLMVGTSTGGIIAAGLACPKPNGDGDQSAASIDEIVTLYETKGDKIFQKPVVDTLPIVGPVLGGLRKIFRPAYKADNLETELELFFQDKYLGSAMTDLVLTTYDIEARDAVFMSSKDSKKRDIFFREATRATSAAPTFLPPAKVGVYIQDDGGNPQLDDYYRTLVDGGVFANDPIIAAYAEARKADMNDADTYYISLGTGSQNRPYKYDSARSWGLSQWISPSKSTPIISVLMQGQASTAAYQANKLLNKDVKFRNYATSPNHTGTDDMHYHRIDGQLNCFHPDDAPSDALDDVSPDNIRRLKQFAVSLISEHEKTLEKIVRLIKENDPSD